METALRFSANYPGNRVIFYGLCIGIPDGRAANIFIFWNLVLQCLCVKLVFEWREHDQE